MENDPFRHALVESAQPAAHEFMCSLREKLGVIKQRYPHKESTVDSCLRGLEDGATLGHILVAAYVLNGGVSLKFSLSEEGAEDTQRDVQDFESLLQEIEGRIAGTDLSRESAPVATEVQLSEVLIEGEDPLTEPPWMAASPEPEDRAVHKKKEGPQPTSDKLAFTLQ